MSQTSFADLVVTFWDHILMYVWPLKFRHEGFSIIRKTCGAPGKIYSFDERWCWKLPFIQSFDEVDMKSHTFNSTAHSFLCNNKKSLPYNIIIDTQVEFCIKNPLVIYKIDSDFKSTPNPLYSFISNEVHSIIMDALDTEIIEKNINSQEMQEIINKSLNDKVKNVMENAKYENDILIEKIVITSYDYNISLRLVQ